MGKKRDEEDLADVEVERMPDLAGWEYYKAVDGDSQRERWTLAILHKPGHEAIEYALWTDIKADPSATGALDARQEKDKRWAKAARRAMESSAGGALDNDARAEIALTILKRHDKELESYEERLLFTLEPPPDEDEDEGEADEDDNDDGDSDDDE